MARGTEVTIAGKRYENAAAYLRSLIGSLRIRGNRRDDEPVSVTIRPNEELDVDEAEALA
jgi:hypothetical protein